MRLADLFDCFLIDLDGVVYVGEKPTEGAVETIEQLKKSGKIVIFLTNDPRKTAAEYSEKLGGMGIAVSPGDVVTSGMAIAHHIRRTHPDSSSKTAYVVGSPSLKKEIDLTGLRVVSGEEAKEADFVIVGGHPDFHYDDIKFAALAVRRGAEFYATNRDPAYPSPEGPLPATGAMLAAIETACGRRAVVAGKPEVIMFEVAIAEHMHRDRDRFAIIGDRIDTDVQGGKNTGIGTILALSGSTSEEDVIESETKPDHLIRDLRDLLRDIPE